MGLLDIETILTGDKSLLSVRGRSIRSGATFSGYEMHVGRTDGKDCANALHILDDGRREGAVSRDGRVAGTYVHGLFADDNQRRAWLEGSRRRNVPVLMYEAQIESVLDSLADHLESCLDLEQLLRLAR